jgi:hypothetical protein
VTAAGSSSGGTSSALIACQAGFARIAPRPSTKVKPSSRGAFMSPAKVRTLSAAAAARIRPWVASNRRRRFTISASAPAGKPTRKTGNVVAVCISAIKRGDAVKLVMSHTPPTFGTTCRH